jgi:hypothetical protein
MDAAIEIEQAFSFLEQDLAYRRGRSEYHRAQFGNALVEYQSPRLRIRVTKDRGQFFCAFAAPKEPVEWFDQEIILRDLGEGQAADDFIAQRWSSLDAVATSVRRTIERICERFGEETYSESRGRFKEGQLRRVRKLVGDKIADQMAGKRGLEPQGGG